MPWRTPTPLAQGALPDGRPLNDRRRPPARDARPAHRQGDRRPAADRPAAGAAAASLVYGFHAVEAALLARRRRLVAIHATEAAAARLAEVIDAAGLRPTPTTAEALNRRLGPDAVHQGVLLEAGPVETIDLSDIAGGSGLVLVLDQVTDPHNVGAIVRTAAAFAVDALVTTQRHMPELAGVVAKAASGGLDHLPVAAVTNLARALDELADLGYWRVGLDSEAPHDIEAVPLRRPLALVLGAEGAGLRRLTRERCDALARLDMPGAIKSLNVSNACAVALALVRGRLAREG